MRRNKPAEAVPARRKETVCRSPSSLASVLGRMEVSLVRYVEPAYQPASQQARLSPDHTGMQCLRARSVCSDLSRVPFLTLVWSDRPTQAFSLGCPVLSLAIIALHERTDGDDGCNVV
ncbi:hypothetical protein ABW21_db0205657 [Orbilia brochopaga]|nr:hypothetical protein ABW21_db0205657 [Drechslerella brochopaga]